MEECLFFTFGHAIGVALGGDDMGTHAGIVTTLAVARKSMSSMAMGIVLPPLLKARAECGSSARSDLCRGLAVKASPYRYHSNSKFR